MKILKKFIKICLLCFIFMITFNSCYNEKEIKNNITTTNNISADIVISSVLIDMETTDASNINTMSAQTMYTNSTNETAMEIDTYVDAICHIVSEHGGFGWGADFGLYDINNDGIFEIIMRDGMHANIEIYNGDGTFFWANAVNAFGTSDEFTTKQVKTGSKNSTLYFGIGGNTFIKTYTVEPIGEAICMCIYVSNDAITHETEITANIYDFTNVNYHENIINADNYIVETGNTNEEVYVLYDKYFGKYTNLSDENILNVHKIEFNDMAKALYEGDMTLYRESLYNAIANAMN